MTTRLAKLSSRFVEGGWLPPTKEAHAAFLKKLISDTDKHKEHLSFERADRDAITTAVLEFRNFIIRDADMFMGFNRMFEQSPDDTGIRNFDHFIQCLNYVLHNAPTFGHFGPPLYMILFRAMDTQGGFTAFLADKLNERFKILLNLWSQFLDSPASTNVLNDEEGGWFHTDAVYAVTSDYTTADGQVMPFDAIFQSDLSKPYWGFTSWDDYFNREFVEEPKPGFPLPRPVGIPPPEPRSDDIIGGACESVLYNIQKDVKRKDAFWIKGEPYSLEHMLRPSLYTILGYDDIVAPFVGGTILQGFLQVTGYHRWAAPVAGRIVKIVDVPGTYFVQSPAWLPGEDAREELDIDPNDPANHPYVRSLAFITSLTARQLIFIESSNEKIGLMCFIAIGMTEVSSCQATVREGQMVQRGDELGMFHFGGSSHALIFRAGVDIIWFDDPQDGDLIKVRSAIGGVKQEKEPY